MSESVANLRRENNALKIQLNSLTDEVEKLKESLNVHRQMLTVKISVFPKPKKVPTAFNS